MDKSVHPHESPLPMTVPLILLAVLSVFAGWLGVPHGLATVLPGHPGNILEHWLSPVILPIPGMGHADVSLEISLMVFTTLLGLATAVVAYVFYVLKPGLISKFVAATKALQHVVYNKYFIDEIYARVFLQPLVQLSKNLWVYIDIAVIDKTTHRLTGFIRSAGDGMRALQSGQIQTYSLVILIGVVASVLMLIL